MKRFLAILLISFCLCNCIGGYYLAIAEEKSYDEEFDRVLGLVESMGQKANLVATYNILVWQEVGPQEVMNYLAILLAVGTNESVDGVMRYLLYKNDYCEIFGVKKNDSNVDGKILDYAIKYADAYGSLTDDVESVKGEIKDLRSLFEDHSEAIKALQDYYIKATAYADFALNPSGNRISYHTNHETFEKEMDELKINAEFEK